MCHIETNIFHCSRSVVQLLIPVWLFATPWTAAQQSSLSFSVSWSLLKLMSIVSVMPSSHLIFCHPILHLPSMFPSIRVFFNELALHTGGQSVAVSASVSVLPMNVWGWLSLDLTHLISLLSKRLSRVFSSTTGGKHEFFGSQSSLWSNSHIHTWFGKVIVLTIWTFVSKVTSQFLICCLGLS